MRNAKQFCKAVPSLTKCFNIVLHVVLQAFSHFTYVTAHSPTLPSLYLRHSSFSNPSVASPTSQLILQPSFRFSYVTGFSLTSPGEPPMFSVHELGVFLLYLSICLKKYRYSYTVMKILTLFER